MNDFQILRAARQWLAYWGLKPEHRTLILADTDTYEPLLRGMYTAAQEIVPDTVLVTIPARSEAFTDIPRLAEDFLLQSDFHVSLTSEAWTYSPSYLRVVPLLRDKGAKRHRWDGTAESVPHFVLTVPDEDVHERSKRAAALIDAAKDIRITSRVGTDLRLSRGDPKVRIIYAPAGQAAFAPPEDSVDGVIHFQGGIVSRQPSGGVKRMVYQPIQIQVEGGRITHIEEDHEAAIFLAQWFRQWDDPDVYRISHVNLGVDHRIQLHHLDNKAVHFNYGGILMGFGLMHTPVFGNDDHFQASAHIELQLTGASYAIDGRPILSDGEFTEDSGLRA